MKEIDDTTPPKTESEAVIAANAVYALLRMDELEKRIANLEAWRTTSIKRIAHLEAQRPPQATNQDPEWYS